MALMHVEVNIAKIIENIKNLQSLVKPETKSLVVVKSNAYGHGIEQIAKAAVEAGANWLGVVNIEEGLKLREIGIRRPILVLGYPDISQVQSAAQRGIAIPVVSVQQAEQLAKFKLSYPLIVHLKVETGINRLGLQKNEVIKVYNLLKKNPRIVIEGIYSHFASVEEQDMDYSKKQIKKFNEILLELKKKKINIRLRHLSATSAVMLLPEAQYDMVRLGIGSYGLWPSSSVKKTFLKQFKQPKDFLQSALEYKTQIVQVKNVKKGQAIGYGCTYKPVKNTKIAILPVGYYEGFDRAMSNKGEILIRGQRCPIIGRVCMNMSIADVSAVAKAIAGDEVVLIGCQGSEEITADQFAKVVKSINYEVVTRIPEHIPRIYKM